MPRSADHEQRRRQIAAAATAIAVADGLGRVTVSQVAARAGISVGLVQHYFHTKDALVERAFTELLAAANGRITELVERGERRGRTVRDMVVDGLAELLPVDGPRRAEALARAEFTTLAARHDDLQAVARAHEQSLRLRLARVVGNAQECGEAAPDADARALADQLWATTSGATTAMLVDPSYPGPHVLALAAREAFPHPCRRHG